jgi:4'-phosphopantetheinyl transferase EntD
MSNAVAKRCSEFAAGRAAAREALAAIGFPPAPMLTQGDGVPAWPQGVVGSITHTDRWALAVVSNRDRLLGLGVDLESDAPLEPDLTPEIRRPNEKAGSLDLAARGIDDAKLRFVAKEAYFKAVFPLTRYFLSLEAVSVELCSSTDRFRAHLVETPRRGADAMPADGFYLHSDGLICALCTLAL